VKESKKAEFKIKGLWKNIHISVNTIFFLLWFW